MGRNSASVKVGDGLRAISIKELIDSLQKEFRASTNSLIGRRKKGHEWTREPSLSTANGREWTRIVNRVAGMIDWREAALARDGWISRIGYGACLAQKCVQQAAPANVASV
jgi:hypothetical protein